MRTTTTATTDRAELAAWLRAGGVAAVPTDTVYGLIAAADNADAARRIYELKGRPDDKKLILLAGDIATAAAAATLTGEARVWAEKYWPGPLTLILPVPGGEPTGLRVPDHAWLRAFLLHYGSPVVSTSANRSDQPSATAADAVRAHFGDAKIWLIDDGPSPGGQPSTIIDTSVTPPRLLRAGPLAEWCAHVVC